MWVSLIQSVEGIKSKNWVSPEKKEFCLKTITEFPAYQPACRFLTYQSHNPMNQYFKIHPLSHSLNFVSMKGPNWYMHACSVTQSCPTLCDPMDCSLPGSSAHGIFQARILEWMAISYSTAAAAAKSLQSYPTLCDPIDGSPPGSAFWSELPFPSAVHESEKWKWSRSVVSNSLRPHGLRPTRLLRPWDFPGKSTGVGCHCLLRTDSGT